MALGWQSITANAAVRVAVAVATQATSFATPAQPVTQFGWYQQLSKAPPVAQARQGHATVPFNTPQVVVKPPNGWYAPLSIAPPVAKAQLGSSFVPFNTAQTAAAAPPNGWFGPIATAPKTALAQPTQATSFAVPPQAPPPAVTPGQFGWYAPLSNAVPVAQAKAGNAFVPFDTVQTATPSTTQAVPLVYDAGYPRATNVYYQAMFNPLGPMAPPAPNTVTGMPWQQPLSKPVPVAQALQGNFFVPFNTAQITNHITAFGWYAPLSKPAPVAIAQTGSTFVPFDTVQVAPPPPPAVVPAGGTSLRLDGRPWGASYRKERKPVAKVEAPIALPPMAKVAVAPAPQVVVAPVVPIEVRSDPITAEDEAIVQALIEHHMQADAQARQTIMAMLNEIIAELENDEDA